MTREKRLLILGGEALFFAVVIVISTKAVFPIFREVCGPFFLCFGALVAVLLLFGGIGYAGRSYGNWMDYWYRHDRDD